VREAREAIDARHRLGELFRREPAAVAIRDRPAGGHEMHARQRRLVALGQEGRGPQRGQAQQDGRRLQAGAKLRRLDRRECWFLSQVFLGQDVYARAARGPIQHCASEAEPSGRSMV
jgi:hypothetical protein